MFPCRFALSTRSIEELAARKAIQALEGKHIEDVREYIDHPFEKVPTDGGLDPERIGSYDTEVSKD